MMTDPTDADRLREIARALPTSHYADAADLRDIAHQVQIMEEALNDIAEQARRDQAEMGQLLPFVGRRRRVPVTMIHETPDGAA